MGKTLSVSVIVVAHDRKEFIIEALQSVVDQEYNLSPIEIIVVKNFEDEVTDNYIASHNIVSIYSSIKTLGGKIAQGVERAKGEIISFLEDDDIFLREKMTKIMGAFNNSEVCYVHNGFSLIDVKGRYLRSNLFHSRYSSFFLDAKMLDRRKMRLALKRGGFFNLSCISIRRNLLISHLKELRKFQVATDNFMFYLALDSGRSLYLCSETMTKYRIHDSNISITEKLSLQDFVSKKGEFLLSDSIGYRIIESSVSNMETKHCVECRQLLANYALSILKEGHRISFKDHIAMFKCLLDYHSFELFALASVYFISRIRFVIGVVLYATYETHKIQKLLLK